MIENESFAPLTQDETRDLLARAKVGDEDAKSRLVAGNFPLIKSVLKRFQFKGVEYDDLYQLGCVGFLKAIKNFDEQFGVKFSTYAVPMIAGEIKRFLRDDGAIKVSRAIKTLSVKVRAYIDEHKKRTTPARPSTNLPTTLTPPPKTSLLPLTAPKIPCHFMRGRTTSQSQARTLSTS